MRVTWAKHVTWTSTVFYSSAAPVSDHPVLWDPRHAWWPVGGPGGREKQKLMRTKGAGLVALRISSGSQLALKSRMFCTLGDRVLPG